MTRRPARIRARVLAAAALLWTGAALAEGPRVASINLCTDQLLVALADPDQILGLSPYAADRARSSIAERAAQFRRLSGSAEDVLVLRPDLVLAGRYTKRATRELLRSEGVQVTEFDVANSIAQATDQIRRVGDLVGHSDRAAAAVAAIDAAVARAREAASGRPLTVLPLQRRGWVSGRETLMTSLLDSVGLRNAGAELSGNGRQVGLEAIVALKPDLLLVSRSNAVAEDQGSALLQHPALAGLYPAGRRLFLPEQMTVCGGLEIGPALDHLAAEIAKLP